uniref:Uncharacterized protein n=1 Tax=Rhizophora mucronata TaxID=61149 RepID=A0A2P2P3K7_RHIMU
MKTKCCSAEVPNYYQSPMVALSNSSEKHKFYYFPVLRAIWSLSFALSCLKLFEDLTGMPLLLILFEYDIYGLFIF